MSMTKSRQIKSIKFSRKKYRMRGTPSIAKILAMADALKERERMKRMLRDSELKDSDLEKYNARIEKWMDTERRLEKQLKVEQYKRA